MRAGWRSAAAALGVLALAGLTACGADSSVAAYVDHTKITETEVDEVVDGLETVLAANHEEALAGFEAQLEQRVSDDDEFTDADAAQELADAEQQQAEQLADQLVQVRDRVVEMRVLTAAATGYTDDEGLEVVDPPVGEVADQLGIPPENGYAHVVAEFFAVMGALQSSVEPVAPSEADQREVYDGLVEEGMTGVPFEDAQQVLNQELIGERVAMRNLLVEVVDRVDITLNPRYSLVYQVPVQVGNAETSIGVPLGDSAVVEAG